MFVDTYCFKTAIEVVGEVLYSVRICNSLRDVHLARPSIAEILLTFSYELLRAFRWSMLSIFCILFSPELRDLRLGIIFNPSIYIIFYCLVISTGLLRLSTRLGHPWSWWFSHFRPIKYSIFELFFFDAFLILFHIDWMRWSFAWGYIASQDC